MQTDSHKDKNDPLELIRLSEELIATAATAEKKTDSRFALVKIYYSEPNGVSEKEKILSYLMDIVNEDSDNFQKFQALYIWALYLEELHGFEGCKYKYESNKEILFKYSTVITSVIKDNLSSYISCPEYNSLLKTITKFLISLKDFEEDEIEKSEVLALKVVSIISDINKENRIEMQLQLKMRELRANTKSIRELLKEIIAEMEINSSDEHAESFSKIKELIDKQRFCNTELLTEFKKIGLSDKELLSEFENIIYLENELSTKFQFPHTSSPPHD